MRCIKEYKLLSLSIFYKYTSWNTNVKRELSLLFSIFLTSTTNPLFIEKINAFVVEELSFFFFLCFFFVLSSTVEYVLSFLVEWRKAYILLSSFCLCGSVGKDVKSQSSLYHFISFAFPRWLMKLSSPLSFLPLETSLGAFLEASLLLESLGLFSFGKAIFGLFFLILFLHASVELRPEHYLTLFLSTPSTSTCHPHFVSLMRFIYEYRVSLFPWVSELIQVLNVCIYCTRYFCS